MIALSGELDFLASNSSIFAVKILAQREIYGERCDFWVQRVPDGALVISRLGGCTICGDAPGGASLTELRAFLDCVGGAAEGDAALLRRAVPHCAALPVMAAPEEGNRTDGRVAAPDRLQPVHALLCGADARFAAQAPLGGWLSDFSHRCRHGFSECFILTGEDRPIATFSILFRAAGRALGGALAVEARRRGEGLGSALLSHAAAVCQARGERLFLLAADETRAAYYRRRGWTQWGLAARCDDMTEEV